MEEYDEVLGKSLCCWSDVGFWTHCFAFLQMSVLGRLYNLQTNGAAFCFFPLWLDLFQLIFNHVSSHPWLSITASKKSELVCVSIIQKEKKIALELSKADETTKNKAKI